MPGNASDCVGFVDSLVALLVISLEFYILFGRSELQYLQQNLVRTGGASAIAVPLTGRCTEGLLSGVEECNLAKKPIHCK